MPASCYRYGQCFRNIKSKKMDKAYKIMHSQDTSQNLDSEQQDCNIKKFVGISLNGIRLKFMYFPSCHKWLSLVGKGFIIQGFQFAMVKQYNAQSKYQTQ